MTMTHQLPVGESIPIDVLIDRLGQVPSYSIGRLPGNALLLPNGRVSGQHACLIRCSDHVFILEDLGSKNGTFVNEVRISRKIISTNDHLRFADCEHTVGTLLALLPPTPTPPLPPTPTKEPLDFTTEFGQLQAVFEQYPKLRKNCRDREKMIRTGSVILSSVVGITAVLSTGGVGLPLIHVLSGAGLSMLVPTLCSSLLSTEEKLEVIDKEYRERYRCPNPACRDPFGTREWEALARQKICRHCKAVWMG